MLLAVLLTGLITFGQPTLPPMQWSRFAVKAEPISVTAQPGGFRSMRDLDRVNAMVNSGIVAKPEAELAAGNTWRVWPAEGWCGDFVVTKRQELLKRGWPSHALLIAIVGTPEGAAHAVLLVNADNGWVALDNLNREILPAARLRYKPIMLQGAESPHNWYAFSEWPK